MPECVGIDSVPRHILWLACYQKCCACDIITDASLVNCKHQSMTLTMARVCCPLPCNYLTARGVVLDEEQYLWHCLHA